MLTLLTLTLIITLSPTTVHPETLVWSDEFDTPDESKWEHLVTTYPLVTIKDHVKHTQQT